MLFEGTKRSRDIHQRLKLGAAIIASIAVAAVLAALLYLVSIRSGVLTPPLGEYSFGPLAIISLYDRQYCPPNQVCAYDAYVLYLDIRTTDQTSFSIELIRRPGQ